MVLHEEDSDDLLSRLFRRSHGATCPTNTHSLSSKSRRVGSELQTLAVTNLYELSRELDATERALHPNHPSVAELSKPPRLNSQMTQYPAWDELDEIFRDLHDVYDKSLLTLREQEYAAVLTQATVNVLAQACLTSEGGDLDASGVRVKLLELAVLPSPQWRRLALTLFLNTSVASLTAILSTQQASLTTRAQQLEVNLFKLLREMLAKAVVVSTSVASESIVKFDFEVDWVDQAVGCVEFFVKKANGNYSSDHLRSLDEHTLLFLVAEASNRDTIGSELQLKAMELVVATMYALKVTGQLETKDHVVWNCGLPVAAVEQYVSLELLLYHFYTSPIARLQRLACMVLVDLVCEQLRRTGSREGISNAGLDQIWRSFVDWEDPPEGMKQTLLSPYISSSRVVKQLLPSCSLASEKQLNVFVNQFRLVVQVDAYFGVNPGLDKAVKAAKNQSGGNVSEEIIDQVLKLLLSNRAVERFRGERWLAELLSYDQDDDGFSSYDSKATTAVGSVGKQHEVLLARPKAVNNPVGEELEETFCYDEGGEISLAAQAKFWQLASPTNAVERRVSFTRVLALFIRRKLQLSSGKPDASIMEEINTCVGVLLDHKEREPAVLLPVMLLILEVCQCELSYVDKRWKQRDARTSSNEQGEEEVADCVAWSDSLASRVLNGDVALDKKLLRQMDAEFLLHVLTVLHERSDTHQGFECRRICCGVDDSLVGDVAACTALVVCSIFTDNNVAVDNVGGLTALTPFLQTCDTRIAVFMAKLISELMKQSDEAQYAAFLRELYVACVEADDESALYNSYLHTQTLLHNVEVGM
ncbi:hypothetical protein GN244_ATG13070 [Phytophthora infestans]|uniref:Uncharacterized protein n=1 Tax=Phytophthora infestans TaxID=4787 RepID=A0A833WHH4_PHYIN|nr:hypothetical protein GN244_ATG13070 [Phytophthora infestans]KAF4130618.1 hypothetical protein GN958_ATG20200 [Phytophthora infestans]